MKVGGAETDPEDVRMAEKRWEAGGRQFKRDVRSGDPGRDQLHDQLQDAGRGKSGGGVEGAAGAGARDLHGEKCASDARGQADLVTEMKEVKHPYTKGILAQRGIDY